MCAGGGISLVEHCSCVCGGGISLVEHAHVCAGGGISLVEQSKSVTSVYYYTVYCG